jgi:hypothetical protein
MMMAKHSDLIERIINILCFPLNVLPFKKINCLRVESHVQGSLQLGKNIGT